MEKAFWLMDKLPMPLVIHHQDEIKHFNQAFSHLMKESADLTHFDFIKWLQSIIPNKKQSELLVNAIINNEEYTSNTDVSFKGVIRQWIIFTSPMPTEQYQLTYLYDESINKISKSYWDLHIRISKATMQLIKEINERKKAESKAAELSNQLIIAARRAGMTDIATSVLHNVGNISNSVNTSISVILNDITKSKLSHLKEVVKIIDEHTKSLQAQDDKLSQALQYASLLGEVWEEDKNNVVNEIMSLQKNMDYINKIITTQQSLSDSIGMIEEISIQDIINDALTINKSAANRNNIEIIQNFKLNKKAHVDRVKLLQILTNLIKNSVDSLTECKKDNKKIIVSLQEKEDKTFVIQVIDNGIGISFENKNKIYNYGFTTKKDGHGFGLHTSSLAAKEMGGLLVAESEGENLGATFSLTLPLEPKAKEHA